jgi:Domain of unknown function (DUF4190)/Protein of unknown function (DUF2510)
MESNEAIRCRQYPGMERRKTGIMSGQAGWYPQPDGSQRYWDGATWTAHSAAPVAIAPTNFRPEVPGSTQLISSLPFSGKAIAAFVLSLFWLGGIGSIVAIFLATGAIQEVRQGARSGHGLAVAALVLAIVGIVLSVVFIIVVMYMGQDLNNQFNQISDCVNSPTAPGCP